MRRTRIVGATALAALALGSGLMLYGCGPQGSKEVTLEPTISGSSLVTEGTLTVGVDSTLAPFGGISSGEIIGVDVDIAAAIATELGLQLEIVDTSGENVVNMLQDGEIDIAMSITVAQTQNTEVATIGPYLENGPALFGLDTDGTSVDLDQLTNSKIGAYTNSIASRTASAYCGTSNLVTYTSLSEAFEALVNNEIDYVASDSVAGGYLSMSYEGVGYAAFLDDPSGVYLGVLQTNTTLSDAVLDALSTIESNGVLSTIAAKWTGIDCASNVMPTSEITLNEPVTTTSSSSEDEGEDEDEDSEDVE